MGKRMLCVILTTCGYSVSARSEGKLDPASQVRVIMISVRFQVLLSDSRRFSGHEMISINLHKRVCSFP
jgi:hypothetical protein